MSEARRPPGSAPVEGHGQKPAEGSVGYDGGVRAIARSGRVWPVVSVDLNDEWHGRELPDGSLESRLESPGACDDDALLAHLFRQRP